MTDDTEQPWSQAPVRTYRGHIDDGTPVVMVDPGTGAGAVRLEPRENSFGFSWGNKGFTMGESDLAFAILKDAFGPQVAMNYHQRFKYRVVAQWSAGMAWAITLPEVKSVVDTIKQVEQETAGERARIARMPPPIVNEGGGGIGRSEHDHGPDSTVPRPVDPATAAARESAISKLTPEERKALGL